jgi:hypothetical protein
MPAVELILFSHISLNIIQSSFAVGKINKIYIFFLIKWNL